MNLKDILGGGLGIMKKQAGLGEDIMRGQLDFMGQQAKMMGQPGMGLGEDDLLDPQMMMYLNRMLGRGDM